MIIKKKKNRKKDGRPKANVFEGSEKKIEKNI